MSLSYHESTLNENKIREDIYHKIIVDYKLLEISDDEN